MENAYEHTLHSYSDPKEKRQFVQIVATAHHNAAVEYEFLGYMDQSLAYYQKAFSVAIQNLGSEHPLTQTFERSLVEARRKAEATPQVERNVRYIFDELSQLNQKRSFRDLVVLNTSLTRR